MNSRPLTEVSSDVDDLEALTPNHFIIGRGTLNLPPGIFVDRKISSHKRWRQAQDSCGPHLGSVVMRVPTLSDYQ